MEIAELVPQDFHGVISLVRGDQVLFRQAHGYADLANRIPNTIDTRFQTASAGKAFVAVGILQLVERGSWGWRTPSARCWIWISRRSIRPSPSGSC